MKFKTRKQLKFDVEYWKNKASFYKEQRDIYRTGWRKTKEGTIEVLEKMLKIYKGE